MWLQFDLINHTKRTQLRPFLCFLQTNFDLSHTMFAQTNRLFCTAFSKAVARAALAQKTAFSFCKAFSFVPLVAKEKAIKDKQ